MKKTRLAHMTFLAAALLGMVILRISTRHGAGIGGDATIYLTSAQNLLEGHGFGLIGPRGEFRLLPYFAPFFPLVLSFLGWLGFQVEAAALGLNILLFGGTIWLAASEAWRASSSLKAAWLTALLLGASPVLVPVFSWAMSEPLSIFLGFLALAWMLGYLREQRPWLFAAAALAGGLAFMTRYAAGAYLGAATLLLLLFEAGGWGKRVRKAALFTLAGSLPVAGWMLYSLSQTTTVSSRTVLTGAVMLERIQLFWPQLEEVILFWLVPDSWIYSPPYPPILNHVLSVGFVAALVVWTVVILRKSHFSSVGQERSLAREAAGEEPKALYLWQTALALFSVVYVGVIALVYFTTYPPITIGSRMLSPLMAAIFWLMALLALQTGRQWKTTGWLQNGVLAVLVLLGTWNAVRTVRIVRQNYELGLGYNSIAWQTSDTVQAVRELPQDTLIITNEETALLYLTGRASYPLAEIFLDQPEEIFQRYGDGELKNDPAEQLFRNGEAVLVEFGSLSKQVSGLYGVQSAEWAAALLESLEVIYQGGDGGIYRYPEK